MNKIDKTIVINAPVHAVFKTISEPGNLRDLCTNLTAVEDIERLPNGGKNFKWEYKLVDVHFFGTSTCAAFEHDHRLTSTIQGGITGTMTWLFETDEEEEGTRITLNIDYALPSHFEQKHGLAAITAINEAAVSSLLKKLKATVEKPVGQMG